MLACRTAAGKMSSCLATAMRPAALAPTPTSPTRIIWASARSTFSNSTSTATAAPRFRTSPIRPMSPARLEFAGPLADPINFGPPNLSFTNFGALTDGSPVLNRSRACRFTETVSTVKGQHNMSAGMNFTRSQLNLRTDSNARGSFSFSGLETSAFDAAEPIRMLCRCRNRLRFRRFPAGAGPIEFGAVWDFKQLFSRECVGRFRAGRLARAAESHASMPGCAMNTTARSRRNTGIWPTWISRPDLPPPRWLRRSIRPLRRLASSQLGSSRQNNFAPRIGIAWKPAPGSH